MKLSHFRISWLVFGILVFLLGVLAFPATPTFACSTSLPPKDWTPPSTTSERIKAADIIFEGTVTEVNPGMGNAYALVKVDRIFKGQIYLYPADPAYFVPDIYLHYHCSVGVGPGHHAIFYAQNTQYGALSIDYTMNSGEDQPAPEVVAQIIKQVGQPPLTRPAEPTTIAQTTVVNTQTASSSNTPGITQNNNGSTTSVNFTDQNSPTTETTPHKIDDDGGTTGWYLLTILGIVLVGVIGMLALNNLRRGKSGADRKK